VHALSAIFVVIVLGAVALASGALYVLPALIGSIRRVPDIGSVAAINVLLGWTLIGWVVALAMSLRSVGPAPPPVQVVQNFGPPPPWPGRLAGAGWAGPPGPPPPRPGVPPPLSLPPRHPAAAPTAQGQRSGGMPGE
jgi:hypothetical protein